MLLHSERPAVQGSVQKGFGLPHRPLTKSTSSLIDGWENRRVQCAMDYVGEPRTMAHSEARAARLERLHDANIAQLTQYVEALRQKTGKVDGVPFIDPLDGGVNAQVLLLLEAPGGKAAAGDGGAGSGFVSRNNDDATAARVFKSCEAAGLPREQTLIWNIVPWYVGSEGVIRAVTSHEVEEGRQHLRELLTFLERLQVVVTLGKPAALGWAPLRRSYPDLITLTTWHPSSRGLAGKPQNEQHIVDTLTLARQIVDHSNHSALPRWM